MPVAGNLFHAAVHVVHASVKIIRGAEIEKRTLNFRRSDETGRHTSTAIQVTAAAAMTMGIAILRILLMTFVLFKDERPLAFFASLSAGFALIGLVLGGSVIVEYMETHLVPRFPTAILATGLVLLAFLSLACGLILDSVARGRREIKRLAYLAQRNVSSVAR